MTPSRFVSDLSGSWDFKKFDDVLPAEEWAKAPLQDAMNMPVPSSYNDLTEDAKLRDYAGWVMYERDLAVPKVLKNERVMLRFDAVTHEANIYLNGELIGSHKGGFLPFEIDVTDKLTGGDDRLSVAVSNIIDYATLPVGGKADMMGGLMGTGPAEIDDNASRRNNPNFDFFNYSGITRPVRLYTTPKEAYIEDIVLTSEVNDKDAVINYAVKVSGSGECTVTVTDADGKVVAEGTGLDGSLNVKDVQLWQPGEGYMYDVNVKFGDDEYTEPFGIRTVKVDGTQFLINGRPFYFKGYGKHEDTFPNGRGINLPMNTKDISIMKWQGANSFRTSHYPYSEEMMRLCDREGIVVIDETTAVGVNLEFGGGANFQGQKVRTFDKEHGVQTQEHHKDVIRDLISRDKNHACVVMWSIANEPDSYNEGAYDYFKPLYDLARELDPQDRPCTLISVQSAPPDNDVSAELSDVICLNRYYGWYFGAPDLEQSEQALRKEMDFWQKLGKPVVFTEYGADTVMGLHDTTPVMYTEEYQVNYYRMNNRVFDDYECVTGEQVWNFADFATSQSLLRVQGNKKGIFTRDRKPKLAAHYFKERWHQIPDFDYQK